MDCCNFGILFKDYGSSNNFVREDYGLKDGEIFGKGCGLGGNYSVRGGYGNFLFYRGFLGSG